VSVLEDSRVLLYGGMDDEKTSLGDVWILSTIPGKYKWYQPSVKSKITGKTPLSRYNHTACVYKSNVIIFGGCYLGYILNDVWMLQETSPNQFLWVQLHSGSLNKETSNKDDKDSPHMRFQHSATLIEDQMVLINY
jgi:hypothetical protein